MLIVFEGIDGSGKSTQFRLLKAYLEKNGIECLALSFPRYESLSSGPIRMYLNGELGDDPDDVNVYASSMFYAVDRYASYKSSWQHDYKNDKLIISDRYIGSNAIHQGAKFSGINERWIFFKWLEEQEIIRFELPKPDVTIFMKIEPQAAFERIGSRGEKKDIHESKMDYIVRSAEAADQAAQYFGWTTVDASQSQEHIHEEVLQIVSRGIH